MVVHGPSLAVGVLPRGFAVPPPLYLGTLLVAVALVLGVLWRARPPVTEGVILSFAPWMVAGACLYALFQVRAIPRGIAPFFSSPAVYLTTFVFAGSVWGAVASYPAHGWRLRSVPGVLGLSGCVLLVGVLAAAAGTALGRGTFRPFWPGIGLFVSVAVGAVVWTVLTRVAPGTTVTGRVGGLAVFAHALDGVSTAVGVDVLGFGEQTPLSRAVIDVAAALPTSGIAGTGWLFVLVKIAVAAGVVYLLSEYVREAPRQGYLLLGVVVAVGLGPGAHNLVLFAIAGGV